MAFVRPVESEEEVKEMMKELRAAWHDARHCCFAYRLGRDGSRWRVSDDGEPSGTAGRPILGQIDSEGLSDVLVAVVRYFGGVKLGVPGLINAYREAARDALGKAPRVQKVSGRWVRMEFAPDRLPQVMTLVKEMGLEYRGQDFGETCRLEVRVRDSLWQVFLEKNENLSKLATL